MGTNYNPKIVTDGLVLSLDAANSKSYSGTGTLWKDLVSSNSATLMNGVGYSNGALTFNGTTQYVSTSLTKTASCTFSCWATLPVTTYSDMLFNAGLNGSGPDLFFSGTSIYWNTWDSTNNPFTTIPSSATDGKFHNYVVVNDSTSTAKLYYDGNLIATAIYKNASSNTNLYIGGTTASYQWAGNISIFNVHNKALTQLEIKQNFEALRGRYNI